MKMNKHYNELKASYLFVDIAHKVAAYQEAHPEKEIIRLGIGDVTQPLAKCVVQAMRDAAAEMGTKEGFHGYGPEQGYPFLKQAIQGYYASRGTHKESPDQHHDLSGTQNGGDGGAQSRPPGEVSEDS